MNVSHTAISRMISALMYLLIFAVCAFAQTGSVTGRVVDENGVAVMGAVVVALNSKATASTGESGQFEMKVSAGKETLRITILGYGSQYQPLIIAADSSIYIDIQLHEQSMWLEDDCYMRFNPDSTTPGRSTFTGFVKENVLRTPLAGVRISLAADFVDSSGCGHTCWCYSAITDDNGHYTVHDIAPGYRTLYVRADDYRTHIGEITVLPDLVLTANFELERATTGDSLRPINVTGRVWDAEHRIPLAGVTVTLLNDSQHAQTDPDGVFVLPNPVTGNHVLQFDHPGFYAEWCSVNERAISITLKPILLSKRH